MDIAKPYPTPEMKELFAAILTLRTEQEAACFFRDLLTEAELKEFSNRWQMVRMIAKGIPYIDIAAQLKVSTTTVNRVAKWLHNGMGGYQRALTKTAPHTTP